MTEESLVARLLREAADALERAEKALSDLATNANAIVRQCTGDSITNENTGASMTRTLAPNYNNLHALELSVKRARSLQAQRSET